MENRAGAPGVLPIGDLAAEDETILSKSYSSRVFHSAPVVVNDSNLIIFFKGICQTKDIFKVGKTVLGCFKNILRI